MFMPESFASHPDFSSPSFSMNPLSVGVDDIINESSVSLSTSNIAVSLISYLAQTITYTLISTTNSDLNYFTRDQNYSILENITSQITPDLVCSSSGSSTIIYNISSYLDNALPSFASINSTTGVISVTTPVVSANTDYYFYLSSNATKVSYLINKLIKITVVDWAASNCQECLSSNTSAWSIWTSGYYLSSGSWIKPSLPLITNNEAKPSKTAQALEIFVQSTTVELHVP